jgi:ribosomal protein L11 methylase PrmA
VESDTKELKAKECIEKVIDKIQELINEEGAYNLKIEERKKILLRNRSILNKLYILSKFVGMYITQKEYDDLEKEYEKYEREVSESKNLEIISQIELQKYIVNINNKLDIIRVSLYRKIKTK